MSSWLARTKLDHDPAADDQQAAREETRRRALTEEHDAEHLAHDDEHGDVEKVRQLVASLPGENELAVVDRVDHFFTGKIEELGKVIREWLHPALRHVR